MPNKLFFRVVNESGIEWLECNTPHICWSNRMKAPGHKWVKA